MHKRIVKAIELAITQDEDCENRKIEFKIYPQKTQGFWKMRITPARSYMIEQIELIGLSIGRFYGEGLCVTKNRKSITFS